MAVVKGSLENVGGDKLHPESSADIILTSDGSNVQAKLDAVPTTYATKSELTNLANGMVEVVASLPATGVEGKIYLVETSSGSNVYNKSVWENGAYISLGQTSIDLTNYPVKSAAVGGLSLSGHTLTITQADGTTTSTITLPDDDTTYTVDSTLSMSNNEISLPASGVTAGSYGQSADATLANGGTFKVLNATVDAQGRVTGVAEKTLTMPASDNTVGIPVVESNGSAPSNLESGALFFRKAATA